MTDKQKLENLMAHMEQLRQAQLLFFRTRNKALKKDLCLMQDSMDNLLKMLRNEGYQPKKAAYELPKLTDLFNGL